MVGKPVVVFLIYWVLDLRIPVFHLWRSWAPWLLLLTDLSSHVNIGSAIKCQALWKCELYTLLIGHEHLLLFWLYSLYLAYAFGKWEYFPKILWGGGKLIYDGKELRCHDENHGTKMAVKKLYWKSGWVLNVFIIKCGYDGTSWMLRIRSSIYSAFRIYLFEKHLPVSLQILNYVFVVYMSFLCILQDIMCS